MHVTLMHRKRPVIEMDLDDDLGAIFSIGKIYDKAHLPIGIPVIDATVDRSKLTSWWNKRAIPASRSGLRHALEQLKVPMTQALVKNSYGLSLSDQYWVCPQGSNLKWEDINFFNNSFSEDIGNILFGGSAQNKKINMISPDSTSNGWLKKRWKIIDGKRCLIKGGSAPFQQEPLNEVLSSAICRRLNIPHVQYSVLWQDEIPYSSCEDFITENTDLISAYQICETIASNEEDLYKHFVRCCHFLGIPDVTQSLDQMIALDYIVVNTDRHFGNFGAIRNADTLEWVSFAPLFDNGTSLWCNTQNHYINPDGNPESSSFRNKLGEQLDLVQSFDWINFEALSDIDEEFNAILIESPIINDERRDFLCKALRRRVELLEDHVLTQTSTYSFQHKQNTSLEDEELYEQDEQDEQDFTQGM